MIAAGLAAAAEAGLIFLPLMQLSSESARASDGPLGSYAIFVPLYVLGVVAWTAAAPVQRGVWLAAGAAGGAIGLAEALVWGDGNPSATAFLAVLGVLAILRMGTLASRDWKEPVKGALLWGSVAALVEIAVAGSAVPAWRTLLPVVVGQFFVGSLASRAATTAPWAEAKSKGGPGTFRSLTPSLVVVAGFAAMVALAFV